MEQSSFEGKKVFFLYPHSVMQEEMLDELVIQGYEIYILRDHERARRLIERFPGSIMFINIDEGLDEKAWEAYIREIQENPKYKVSLGIFSYNSDRDLMEKYLMELLVPCGYVRLKQGGLKESIQIVNTTLLVNEAKGRRKSFRAICEDESATLNYVQGTQLITGRIINISSDGLAIKVTSIQDIAKDAKLPSVQLKLQDAQVLTNMSCMGLRPGSSDIWVLLFDSQMDRPTTVAIHHFIKNCLQRYIDTLQV
jgi:hypothetical protein